MLFCVASPYGVGAVLFYKVAENVDKPIAFASRTLSSAERNHAHLKKEGLAVIFEVGLFHQYLFGLRFTIVTDYKPLLAPFGKKQSVPLMTAVRIQRWPMLLGAYQYQLVYRPGIQNGNADALSRLPLKETVIVPKKNQKLPRR